MGVKKSKKRSAKNLPPSRPALFGQGEAKPLIIAGIAIVAVLALSLLLLFSDQFVGRAYFADTLNTAGFEDPGMVTEATDPINLIIKANIGAEETVAIEFELPLPSGVMCSGVDEFVSELPWGNLVVDEASCTNNVLTFKAGTIDAGENSTGTFNIASLSLNALPADTYNLQFNSFDIISLNTNNDLISNGESAQLVVEPEVQMCGNSIVNTGFGETCDDGNNVDNDGCTACQIDPGYVCAGQPSTCTECGNGIQEAAELCDGTDFWNNQDQCQQVNGQVYSGGTLGCTNTCDYDFTACEVVNNCGDGVVDTGEGCDDGNLVNGDGCSAACISEAQCGDGVLQAGEACDDNNNMNGDGCSEICAVESLCGNGALNEAEQCDDNNNMDGDGCSATCQLEVQQQPVCGNGAVESGEACDDGNLLNGDGCSSTCQNENQLNLLDQDNDGIDTPEDNCPDTQSQDLTDTDGDGQGDVCDTDDDNDNVMDVNDNCPLISNPNQEDTDLDGIGDACDQDTETPTAGLKISLLNVDSGDNFATKITATEDFAGTEITVWTVLYGADDKVLSIKSEKVPNGLAMNAEYTATSNYPAANVESKSVIVYDVEQGSTVFGELTKDY